MGCALFVAACCTELGASSRARAGQRRPATAVVQGVQRARGAEGGLPARRVGVVLCAEDAKSESGASAGSKDFKREEARRLREEAKKLATLANEAKIEELKAKLAVASRQSELNRIRAEKLFLSLTKPGGSANLAPGFALPPVEYLTLLAISKAVVKDVQADSAELESAEAEIARSNAEKELGGTDMQTPSTPSDPTRTSTQSEVEQLEAELKTISTRVGLEASLIAEIQRKYDTSGSEIKAAESLGSGEIKEAEAVDSGPVRKEEKEARDQSMRDTGKKTNVDSNPKSVMNAAAEILKMQLAGDATDISMKREVVSSVGDAWSVVSDLRNKKLATTLGTDAVSVKDEKEGTAQQDFTKAGDLIEVPALSDELMVMLLEHVFLVTPVFRPNSIELTVLMDRAVLTGSLGEGYEASSALRVLQSDVDQLGLGDLVRLFLFPAPGSGKSSALYSVVVLPRVREPTQGGAGVFFSIISCGITAATTLFYAKSLYSSPVGDLNELSLEFARLTAPFWAVFLGIVLSGDLANRIVAAAKGARLSFPLLLPSLQLGTFGRLFGFERSFPRNRSDLFDIIASGQAIAMSLSLMSMVAGLQAMRAAAPSTLPFPEVSGALFESSWLANTLASTILEAVPLADQNVALHPFFLAGYTGLLVCALNMVPVGKLDGGLISQALLGRRRAILVSGASGVLLGLVSLLSLDSDVLFFWFLVVFFLQRDADFPQQDEVTQPSIARFVVAAALFLVATAFIIPVHPFS